MPEKASLLAQTLWRVLPIIVIVQLGIGWIASTNMNRIVSDELQDRLNSEAEQYPEVVAVKLDAIVQTAVSMAGNDLIKNGLIDAQERHRYIPVFFESVRVPGPAGAEITLTDYKGRRLASNQLNVDHTDAAWLDHVLSGKTWQHLSKDGFVVAVPVMIFGAAEGMVVIQYGTAHLNHLLKFPAEAAATALVSDEQDILYSSNPAFNRYIANDQDGGSSDWEVASAIVPGFDHLTLLTAELRSAAFAAVDRVRYFLWATMAISIGAVILAIVATGFMGSRPINRFITGIEQITKASDLDKRLEPEGAREFHQLAGAFNHMLNSLKATTASRDDLMKANDELTRSNRELDDFAYIASHDLKEPLRAAYNHASFLLEDYGDKLDEGGEKRLNRLIQLSRRMERLIADLLYFSRLGRGEQAMEAVDPNDIIADIMISLADTLQARNGHISIPAPLPMVTGNPAHVTALFQNLISNGTKYNDSEEKIIEIGLTPASQEGASAGFRTLYVRDNGIGIDEKFNDEIFRIFKRLNSEKAYGEGTGAGLTFVKKIIENHGGRIWIESEIDKGTTFYFTLREAA